MGSFDCYCAMCGGPLYAHVRIGKNTPAALERRLRRLRNEQRRRKGESVPDSDHEDDDESVQDDSDTDMEKDEDPDKYDCYDEDHSYDPRLVSEESVEWLGEVRALGFNPNAPGLNKAFITARGSYGDYGDFNPEDTPEDSNDPRLNSYPCYTSYDKSEISVFPFHETCLRLLARVVLGHEKVERFNKDWLYSAMASETEHEDRVLNLDYGEIQGVEQFWESFSGEEHSVANPSNDPEIVKTVLGLFSQQSFSKLPTTLDLGHKVKHDPFEKLPFDILHLIFPYLPFKRIKAWMQASWHVFQATTNDNVFWKKTMRRELKPWFWELENVLRSDSLDGMDCKGAFLWLDHATEARFGMEGPLMGIANRRRIHGVLVQISKAYNRVKNISRKRRLRRDDDPAARQLISQAKSLQMPVVFEPPLSTNLTTSVQWIRSWDEINGPSQILFESFWNSEQILVGLGVTVDGDSRIFGEGSNAAQGIVSQSVAIPAGEWIKGLILHISDVFDTSGLIRRGPQNGSIKALSLTLYSGEILDVVPPANNLNVRALNVSTDDAHIVGLVGQIGTSKDHLAGIITRLGVLQTERTGVEETGENEDEDEAQGDEGQDNGDQDDDDQWQDEDEDQGQGDDDDEDRPQDESQLAFAQRLLWGPTALRLPMANGTTVPIWSYPNLRLVTNGFKFPQRHEEVTIEMVPQQALLWAKDAEELRHIIRLSAYIIDKKMYGFRVEYDNQPHRSIGSNRMPNSPLNPDTGLHMASSGIMEFDPAHTESFDIDGPGGEVIISISIADQGDDCQAVRVSTRKGQEQRGILFGDKRKSNHLNIGPERLRDGEVLAGLVASFAGPEGYHYEEKGYSFLRSTTVIPLALKVYDGASSGEQVGQ